MPARTDRLPETFKSLPVGVRQASRQLVSPAPRQLKKPAYAEGIPEG
ncbi:MAG: hypothetical protein KME26_32285 [Oscillatoria princeps RMCB-10]|nr:hypothetical protein [Oscillatoria princeps RMCB-10]